MHSSGGANAPAPVGATHTGMTARLIRIALVPRTPTMRKLVLISTAVAALVTPGQAGPIAEPNGAGGGEPARGLPSMGSSLHGKT